MDGGESQDQASAGLRESAGADRTLGREGRESGPEGRGQVSERAVDGGIAGHARAGSELSHEKEAT